MKDKIKEMLDDNLVVSGSGMSVLGMGSAVKYLEQLMCYREVRAYLQVPVREYKDWPSYEKIVEFLKADYPAEVIEKAIEQYKNEQK